MTHSVSTCEATARWRYLLYRLCTGRFGLRFLYPLLRAFCRRDSSPGFLHHLYPWLVAETRAQPPPSVDGRHVLIIRPDHIGDFLYSLPAMGRLREGLAAGDSLSVLIDPCNAALAERLNLFDQIFVFRIFGEDGQKLLPSRREFETLKATVGHVDVAIDLRPDGHSGLILERLMPRTTYRISNRQADIVSRLGKLGASALASKPEKPTEHWFYSRAIEAARTRLMFEFADAVAVALGAAGPAPFNDAAQETAELLRQHFPRQGDGTVVFCPEARNTDKEWPAADMQSLVAEVIRRGYRLRIIGQRKSPAFPGVPPTWDLRGRTTLLEALEMVASASAFIGFDSGPAHFAGLVGVPAVTIFNGTTEPRLWAGVHTDGLGWTVSPKDWKEDGCEAGHSVDHDSAGISTRSQAALCAFETCVAASARRGVHQGTSGG